MRRVLAIALLASACTPAIAPGAYFCGPEGACPEDLACDGKTHRCVLPSTVEPFDCNPEASSEPADDVIETPYVLMGVDCSGLARSLRSCMPEGDPVDWVLLNVPDNCVATTVETRVTFPLAHQRLAIEIHDAADFDAPLAVDTSCTLQAEGGDDVSCATAPVMPAGSYLIGITPTGEGDCDGDCAFNSYNLRLQLRLP